MTESRTTGRTSGRVVALTVLGAVAAGAVTLGTAGTATGHEVPGASAGRQELAEVRAATARFHDVAVAEAEGYVPVSHCEQLPGAGAMGVHYLNPSLAGDADVDPTRPELLLYLPKGDRLRLVGVEWFVPEAAAGGTRPEVLGVPFDGPMAGHAPGMPSHYDLHAWIWSHNPDGTFAAWNPALSCGGQS